MILTNKKDIPISKIVDILFYEKDNDYNDISKLNIVIDTGKIYTFLLTKKAYDIEDNFINIGDNSKRIITRKGTENNITLIEFQETQIDDESIKTFIELIEDVGIAKVINNNVVDCRKENLDIYSLLCLYNIMLFKESIIFTYEDGKIWKYYKAIKEKIKNIINDDNNNISNIAIHFCSIVYTFSSITYKNNYLYFASGKYNTFDTKIINNLFRKDNSIVSYDNIKHIYNIIIQTLNKYGYEIKNYIYDAIIDAYKTIRIISLIHKLECDIDFKQLNNLINYIKDGRAIELIRILNSENRNKISEIMKEIEISKLKDIEI